LDEKFYFGFRARGTSPRFVTTAPYLFDLVQFSRVSPDHAQMGGFTMRQEVTKGEVMVRATIGSYEAKIAPKNIRTVSDVFVRYWDSATSQDLFYGTEDKINPIPVQSSK
jgi:hypothetical protein